jgi:hypothetical protein
MSKPVYSKKVREAAALLAQIRACQWAGDSLVINHLGDLASEVDISPAAAFFAERAFMAVPGMPPFYEQWAEAEALLRCGWTP